MPRGTSHLSFYQVGTAARRVHRKMCMYKTTTDLTEPTHTDVSRPRLPLATRSLSRWCRIFRPLRGVHGAPVGCWSLGCSCIVRLAAPPLRVRGGSSPRGGRALISFERPAGCLNPASRGRLRPARVARGSPLRRRRRGGGGARGLARGVVVDQLLADHLATLTLPIGCRSSSLGRGGPTGGRASTGGAFGHKEG